VFGQRVQRPKNIRSQYRKRCFDWVEYHLVLERIDEIDLYVDQDVVGLGWEICSARHLLVDFDCSALSCYCRRRQRKQIGVWYLQQSPIPLVKHRHHEPRPNTILLRSILAPCIFRFGCFRLERRLRPFFLLLAKCGSKGCTSQRASENVKAFLRLTAGFLPFMRSLLSIFMM